MSSGSLLDGVTPTKRQLEQLKLDLRKQGSVGTLSNGQDANTVSGVSRTTAPTDMAYAESPNGLGLKFLKSIKEDPIYENEGSICILGKGVPPLPSKMVTFKSQQPHHHNLYAMNRNNSSTTTVPDEGV